MSPSRTAVKLSAITSLFALILYARATCGAMIDDHDLIRFNVGALSSLVSYAGGAFEVGELRVGTTYADAPPVPLALLITGAIVLLACNWRRRTSMLLAALLCRIAIPTITGLVAMIAASYSSEALAEPIRFTYSGTGSGTIGTTSFTGEQFTITAVGDTSGVYFWGDGYSFLDTTASISISGVGTYSFTSPTQTFVNNSTGISGFQWGVAPYYDFYDSQADPAWRSWKMLSSIGPITGNDMLFQWNNENVTTSGGRLEFNTASTPGSFQATVGAIPEPSTLALLVTGAIGLLGYALAKIRSERNGT